MSKTIETQEKLEIAQDMANDVHQAVMDDDHQRMVELLDKFGPSIWEAYKIYLQCYCKAEDQYYYFSEAVINYHRIRNA